MASENRLLTWLAELYRAGCQAAWDFYGGAAVVATDPQIAELEYIYRNSPDEPERTL